MRTGVIGILLAVLVGTPLLADDAADEALKNWPQWRGPTWNGIASPADPPVSWSETENLRWKTPIEGRGHGTPIIWGDRIFLLTAIPLDREMPIPDVIPPGTPNIRRHANTVHSWKPQRFAIVCIDRNTGKLRWQRTVHEAMPHQGPRRATSGRCPIDKVIHTAQAPPVPTLIDAADDLRTQLRPLKFPDPVSHTYNPLDYLSRRSSACPS